MSAEYTFYFYLTCLLCLGIVCGGLLAYLVLKFSQQIRYKLYLRRTKKEDKKKAKEVQKKEEKEEKEKKESEKRTYQTPSDVRKEIQRTVASIMKKKEQEESRSDSIKKRITVDNDDSWVSMVCDNDELDKKEYIRNRQKTEDRSYQFLKHRS